MSDKKLPFVSVVVPMFNEINCIEKNIESILQNEYPSELVEILVVDGGSKDGSVEVVRKFAKEHSNIKLLGGPGVNCPAAMNVGIREAKGTVVCKIDAHGYIDREFIKFGIKHLQSDKNIKCVGGPIRPISKSIIEESNVLARVSPFGVGHGINTIGEKPQFTDTVQCGIYEKEIFNTTGLFDESLQFGEDEEVNWRIVKAGYKIYCTPEIKFFYYPRNSFKSFYRQYRNYGKARVKVARKFPDYLRIKHFIPSLFIISLLLNAILAVFYNGFLWLFLVIAGFYLLTSLIVSTLISIRKGWRYFILLPVGFACLHMGYGLGFINGVWDYLIRKKG